MKIILSPAKKMKVHTDTPLPLTEPLFPDRTREVLSYMRSLTYEEAKKLWACNDKIAREAWDALERMDPGGSSLLTPAVLAYEGIAYQYMAPAVFEDGHFAYVQDHLRILSAFYGAVRALDGVRPYRLEMQAKARVAGCRDLYAYWGDALYRAVMDESRLVINLASKEYSRCVEKYLKEGDRMVTCLFGEYADRERTKIVQKGVYAKMARGDMVRYMAEKAIEDPEDLKGYERLGYVYSEEESDQNTYVFLKPPGHLKNRT